jgi:hypothetical protein
MCVDVVDVVAFTSRVSSTILALSGLQLWELQLPGHQALRGGQPLLKSSWPVSPLGGDLITSTLTPRRDGGNSVIILLLALVDRKE